nr:hypothetical protein [uncultured Roseateles sp.]
MNRGHLLALTLSALALSAQAQSTDYVVVVGNRSPLKHLSQHDISNVFLGRVEWLPGSGTVRPIEPKDDEELRLMFHAAITGMNEHKLRAHWAAMVFTGKARPPAKCATIDLLRTRLHEDPHAIAYLRRHDMDPALKQVFP